ncbi:TIGR03808 family TAT-translocated repetitive protein [Rhizobium sp. LjRoot98]|uniref:TIGR03808 family TAT-translocated repetitive protein n=1 Tax=unclassified Rhizobium TaxID=2613769 RepID=UPI000712BB1E|nr:MULTISPECIES: TIGR03808 family TAT-translocated repetitive protein [unclassified Rhizobium]KQV37404.1 Tat protein [Rhizobium sp. Root1204]KQY17416.1 Tat protein [Rhizobium sp. Root1334]KRC13298.1 Tat protein [Rhizobium sp. Root73]
MLTRRLLLSSIASLACLEAIAAALKPAQTGLRGTIDISGYGVRPGKTGDQSKALDRLFKEAAEKGLPVFLPAGDYHLSGVSLPDNLWLSGVPGQTRLIHAGGGSFISGEALTRITLSDLAFDGGGKSLGDDVQGLLNLRGVTDLKIENCTITGSARHGINAERCGGRITGNSISQAAFSGLYAVESERLAITANTVSDCGNGGILVHRWELGEDNTIVSGNRVFKIGAKDGGTGENGNGISVFRAGNVMIMDNHISDCAFSAIRANAATNVQISNNKCLRSGETAIYSEFGFQGAIVSGNLVDGAANGILIVNFDEGGRLATVSDNIIRNLHPDGPYIHDGAGFGFGIAAEADTVISGNVIENAPKWGLMLGWGPYMRGIVATGNLVRDAGGGCAVTVVEGAGTALIANNLFLDVKDGAVFGYRWNEKSTGDLLVGGSEAFAHLTLTGNRMA